MSGPLRPPQTCETISQKTSLHVADEIETSTSKKKKELETANLKQKHLRTPANLKPDLSSFSLASEASSVREFKLKGASPSSPVSNIVYYIIIYTEI
jgi:hypothetical protein